MQGKQLEKAEIDGMKLETPALMTRAAKLRWVLANPASDGEKCQSHVSQSESV
jgi:hypothetical protein